jgi:Uma2 family endonuclease
MGGSGVVETKTTDYGRALPEWHVQIAPSPITEAHRVKELARSPDRSRIVPDVPTQPCYFGWMISRPNISPTSRRWKFSDLVQFDETERYEIFDGRLIPAGRPTPDLNHQRISGRLLCLLYRFVELQQLGEVVPGPVDVVMAEDNTAEPDLLFISKENLSIAQKWVCGAPDLVVEIISPSTVVRDRYEKREQYARFGVKEYWLLDSANRSVEILTLEMGRLALHSMATEKGRVESKILAGFTVDLADVY